MKLIFSVLTFFITGQEAIAGSYSVNLREFGFNRVDCHADLKLITEKFAVDAKVQVLSYACVPAEIGQRNSTGKITYAANIKVDVSTSDVNRAYGVDGYYDTVEQCESALNGETELFSRMTGLTPFVNYCYQASAIGSPRFRVRIDAVGTSRVKKVSTSTSFSYKLEKQNDFLSDVRDLVERIDGEFVNARVDRNISGYKVGVDFYHHKDFYLHSKEVLYWKNSEQCLNSAAELKNNWPESAVSSIFYCSTMTQGVNRLLNVYLSENVLSEQDFKTEVLDYPYATQDQCKVDGSRIVDLLEQSGSQVLGFVCGQDLSLNSWNVAVFSKN